MKCAECLSFTWHNEQQFNTMICIYGAELLVCLLCRLNFYLFHVLLLVLNAYLCLRKYCITELWKTAQLQHTTWLNRPGQLPPRYMTGEKWRRRNRVMTHELTFNELIVESQYLLKLKSSKITKIPCLVTAKWLVPRHVVSHLTRFRKPKVWQIRLVSGLRPHSLGNFSAPDSLLNSTQLNSTENYGRRCLTPLSPHRKIYTIINETISLYDFFWSVSGTRQVGCEIKLNWLVLPKLI